MAVNFADGEMPEISGSPGSVCQSGSLSDGGPVESPVEGGRSTGRANASLDSIPGGVGNMVSPND